MTRLLKKIYHAALGKTSIPFKIIFADGICYRQGDAPPAFTIHYRIKAAQLNSSLHHGWGLTESYINGSVNIDGDLKALIRASADYKPSLALAVRLYFQKKMQYHQNPNPSVP